MPKRVIIVYSTRPQTPTCVDIIALFIACPNRGLFTFVQGRRLYCRINAPTVWAARDGYIKRRADVVNSWWQSACSRIYFYEKLYRRRQNNENRTNRSDYWEMHQIYDLPATNNCYLRSPGEDMLHKYLNSMRANVKLYVR